MADLDRSDLNVLAPAAALVIAAVAVREGIAGWRGAACCDAC